MVHHQNRKLRSKHKQKKTLEIPLRMRLRKLLRLEPKKLKRTQKLQTLQKSNNTLQTMEENKMNKKEFAILIKEAETEFENEKRDRVKKLLKERMQELAMAQLTIKRIEKQFKQIKDEGFTDSALLLDYDADEE